MLILTSSYQPRLHEATSQSLADRVSTPYGICRYLKERRERGSLPPTGHISTC